MPFVAITACLKAMSLSGDLALKPFGHGLDIIMIVVVDWPSMFHARFSIITYSLI